MEEKAAKGVVCRGKKTRKILCLSLVALQLWQPFLNIAHAAEVVPTSTGTAIKQAANGVAVVDIAKPGTAGISHNSYTQFDVGSNGLILNNSAQPVNTQLGGYVMGNANVAGGSARLILNEVTAANPSRLEGYMEVAGQKADVIVANPYGITCSGCGFINTAKATLSTGTPFFNTDGSLGGFDVQGGVLRIDAGGLNASNTERLALYTRALELNAGLYAKDLQIIVGSNLISANGSVSATTAAGDIPEYAIDSTALGGMYADTIKLLGTEAGIGMRLSGPIAALKGNFEILNNGDVRLMQASSEKKMAIKSQGELQISGIVAAGSDVAIDADGAVILDEKSRLSGDNINIASASVNAALDSIISANEDLNINAESQRYDSDIASGGVMALTGESIVSAKQMAAGSGLSIHSGTLQNSGRIDVTSGTASIELSGLLSNTGSILHGGDSFVLHAAHIDNSGATLASDGLFNIDLTGAGSFDNAGGRLQGNAGIQLHTNAINNQDGQILADGQISLALGNGSLENQRGLIETAESITINNAASLFNESGTIRAGKDLSIFIPEFHWTSNSGTYSAAGLLGVNTQGDITFRDGDFSTPGSLSLFSEAGDILIEGRVISWAGTNTRSRYLKLGEDAYLVAQGQLSTSASSLDNLGVVYGRDGILLQLDNALNNGSAETNHSAAILSAGDINISAAEGGRLLALNNYGAQIESLDGDINIKAEAINNINLGWLIKPSSDDDVSSSYEYSIDKHSFDTYHYCCDRYGEDVHSTRTETRITTHLFESYGVAGRIVASGNIRVEATDLLNDHSIISAGQVLDIDADRIVNTGTELVDDIQKIKIDRWHTCWYESSWNGSSLECDRRTAGPVITNGSGETHVLPAILEGGSDVILHGTVINGQKEQRGSSYIVDTGAFSGLDINPDDQPSSGGLPIGVADPTQLPGFHLPGSGLFHINPPGHPYLIEADPAFSSYAGFLGSAYLIGQLSWQPGITQRRLGDSYYELMLIRDALLVTTGSRFLDPAIADEKAQYEYLMQQAIAASESLHLTPGIALSREQIDALQQDIVWMEERDIAGEKVLVPVVYLAQGSSRVLQDGAVIGGSNLSIATDTLENGGLISAHDKLEIISTGDISNKGGNIKAGGDLSLESSGDILNESGRLQGNNVLLQADGDIIHRTWSQQDGYSSGNTRSGSTSIGTIAGVEALASMVQMAGGDIRLTAAALKGGNVNLIAGNSVTLDAVRSEQGYQYDSAEWQLAEEHVRYLSSTLEAAQVLSISAGQNITAIAAGIKAGTDVSLAAGKNISLLAIEEKDHNEEHSQHDGTLSDKSYDMTHDESRMVGSYLEAGGNLSLSAEHGDVTLYASVAKSGGHAEVSAAGNINLISGVNTTQHSETENKSNATTFKNHQEGYVAQSAASSSISAGGDLNLDAGKDVNIIASTLYSDATLRIGDADMDQATLRSVSGKTTNLNVGTLVLTNESWDKTQKGLKGPVASLVSALSFVAAPLLAGATLGQVEMPEIVTDEYSKTRSQQTLQAGSSLSAQNMDVSVQNTAAFIGADVNVRNALTISAHDIVIDAAAENSVKHHEEGMSSVKGLDAELDKDKGEYRAAGIQETRTSVSDTQSITQWRGTSINAGQLVLQAENNIDILGSQLKVTGDAFIAAGENLTISGRSGNLTQSHEETREVITVTVAVRNAYVDAALAVKSLSAATDALKTAKSALDEAERKAGLGQLDAKDLDFFRANVVAAGLNLAQAEVAAAGAVLAMGTTGGTAGLYASGSAQREKTVTSSTSQQGIWQGSNLVIGGNAALLAGETLSVKGSDVTVDKSALSGADQSVANSNLLIIDARKIALTAGEEYSSQSSKTRTDQEGGSISLNNVSGVAGGGLNAGYREGDTDSSALHYVNSHLHAGTISSQSDALQIAGAVVEADHVAISTGELIVASLQDEAYSKSRSQGITLGLGFGGIADKDGATQFKQTGGSGSLDYQSSEAERKWVLEQSGIIGHDSISIVAHDTTLTGALIANASRDSNGQLVDRGQLALTTDTLTINHLFDIDTSKTVGGSIGLSLSKEPAAKANGTESNAPLKNGEAGNKPVPHNTTTISATYYGHDAEQTSQATLGDGNIVVGGQTLTTNNATELGLTGLNRDVSSAQAITKDQDIGGLNATLTVDNRVFSEAGLKDMTREQRGAAGTLLNGAGQLLVIGGALSMGEGVATAAKASAALSGEENYISKDAKAAATIDAFQDDTYHKLGAVQDGVQGLADAMIGNGDVLLVDELGAQGKQGGHDGLTGEIYLDVGSAGSTVFNTGHEIGHAIAGPDSERFAGIMGAATQLTWWGSGLINSDAIAAARPSDINILGSQYTQAQANSALLSQNNAELAAALSDHGYIFDFREIFTLRNADGSVSFGDSYTPGQQPTGLQPVQTTASMLSSAEQKQIAERQQQDSAVIANITGTPESCAALQNCVVFDPDSAVAQSVWGASGNSATDSLADEFDEELHRYQLIGASVNATEHTLDTGMQLAASLTLVKSVYDMGDWLLNTSFEETSADIGNLFSTVVDNPTATGVMLATAGLLTHSANLVTTEARAGQTYNLEFGTTTAADRVIAPNRIFTTADVAAPNFASFEARANVLNNFKGGSAIERTYGEGTRLYRIGDRNGAYWATEPPPATELQWRMDYAVQGEWNNMSNLYTIDIPKGSSLGGLEGIVGAQRGVLYGGKAQVFIDWKNVPEDWINTTPLRKQP